MIQSIANALAIEFMGEPIEFRHIHDMPACGEIHEWFVGQWGQLGLSPRKSPARFVEEI